MAQVEEDRIWAACRRISNNRIVGEVARVSFARGWKIVNVISQPLGRTRKMADPARGSNPSDSTGSSYLRY